ncbi:MAG: hypothetical protein ACRDH9_03935 [Actinomycetota bacterium]
MTDATIEQVTNEGEPVTLVHETEVTKVSSVETERPDGRQLTDQYGDPVNKWRVLDGDGKQVGDLYDDRNAAKAAARALNGFGPKGDE